MVAAARCSRSSAVPFLVSDYLFLRDPDPVPDPLARRDRPEPAGRLLRPDLARPRGVHGGGRLRGLQPRAARAAAEFPRGAGARGPDRRAGRHAVRHPEPAHQGPVPRRGHARGAVLHGLGCSRGSSGSPTTRPSGSVSTAADRASSAGRSTRRCEKYLFLLASWCVFALVAKNLVRGHIGRAWMAMRDMDVAAEVIGIRPVYAKLTAFARELVLCRRRRRAVGVRLPRLVGAARLRHEPVAQPAVHDHHRRHGLASSAASSARSSSWRCRSC